MWEKIEALGLEIHISPSKTGWSVGILWDNPPFEQIMAQGYKALIVNTQGESLQETIKEAGLALNAWLNTHKEIKA